MEFHGIRPCLGNPDGVRGGFNFRCACFEKCHILDTVLTRCEVDWRGFKVLKVTDLMIMYSECVVFNCNFDHLLITHIIQAALLRTENERLTFRYDSVDI